MNQYTPEEQAPINYWLYLIGLIIYSAGIIGLPIGINLATNHQDGSYPALLGEILVGLGVFAIYCLITMLVHLVHRYRASHA